MKTKPASKSEPKPDVYARVTEAIISRLEAGVVPWRRPWSIAPGCPRNLVSRKPYQGINIFLLGSYDFPSPFWMTFLQAKEAGGRIRRHAKAAMIVKCGQCASCKTVPEDDEEGKSPRRSYLKLYHVFNLCQIDGIEAPGEVPDESPKGIPAAEAFIAGLADPPEITEGESLRAAYQRKQDRIQLPDRGRFESMEAFYLTLFHELIHATGHENRLNRSGLAESQRRGDPDYSFEELIAEIGASMLGARLAIVPEPREESAAYLACWLERLRSEDNRKWIVNAAAQARKAVEWFLPPVAEDDDDSA